VPSQGRARLVCTTENIWRNERKLKVSYPTFRLLCSVPKLFTFSDRADADQPAFVGIRMIDVVNQRFRNRRRNKMSYDGQSGMVIYRSKLHATLKRNYQLITRSRKPR